MARVDECEHRCDPILCHEWVRETFAAREFVGEGSQYPSGGEYARAAEICSECPYFEEAPDK